MLIRKKCRDPEDYIDAPNDVDEFNYNDVFKIIEQISGIAHVYEILYGLPPPQLETVEEKELP